MKYTCQITDDLVIENNIALFSVEGKEYKRVIKEVCGLFPVIHKVIRFRNNIYSIR